MKKIQAFALVCAVGMARMSAGCEAPVTSADCLNAEPVTGEVTLGAPQEPVQEELLVRGTAQHPSGLAIRTIEVAGIAAQNEGFNFSRWSALVPFDQLAALVGEGGLAQVVVEATDVCGVSAELGRFDVAVDETPGVVVESLSVSVTIADDAGYIPQSGNVPALLTVEANPEAAGALVQLTASSGAFQSVQEGDVVRLGGDGIEPATATVLFKGDSPGVAVITAAAEGLLAQSFVTVAGAPSFIPAGGDLVAGQGVVVAALTEGVFATCSATPTAIFEVLADGVDLVRQPQDFSDDGDGRVDIEVRALDDIEDFGEVTLVCADIYGQINSATFTAEPGDGGF